MRMARIMRAHQLAILLAAALLAQTAGAERIDRSTPADPRGEVSIGNVAGEVRVVGWDRDEVRVEADLAPGVERLDFDRNGPRTVIKVVLPKGRSSHGSTDLIVHVPRASSLSINSVSADQTVNDVRGSQRLQAVSGTINTHVWNEEFEIKTVSGDVVVNGHGGKAPARVTTVSGDVRLQEIGPELDLNTVSGDMQVRVPQLSRARIKTTNGDLELRTALTKDARIDAEGINGDLRFRFRGAVDAEFDIETFNGEIDNCFGPKPRRLREYGPGIELRFKEGNGDGRVRIKALNGRVEICNR
jgi:DUF4097 and DUF4098 domain-containing protein YvlB